MTQDESDNAWDPPANAQSHSTLMMGDSVGYKGGASAATLGPMLESSGKRYWLVTATLFDGAFLGDEIPRGVKLVHPAEIDCEPGKTPKEIGVLEYWSGTKTTRTSRTLKAFCSFFPADECRVRTDWALCRVYDGIQAANRLRYAPDGREFEAHSRIVPGFWKLCPFLNIVRATGRSSGIRYSVVCECPKLARQTGNTRELYLENSEGLSSTADWNSGGTGMPGDGGAAVVEDVSGRLMGMAWGRNVYGGDHSIPRYTYFTSIFDILDDIYEKCPEIGWANLAGGLDPPYAGRIPADAFPPEVIGLGHVTGFVNQETHSHQPEIPASQKPETVEKTIMATDILEQQRGSPQLIDQMRSLRGANTISSGAVEHDAAKAQALQASEIEPTFLGTEDEDVIEIDSDEENVFSDVQSLSSQSSIQAIEVQALREAITSLFLRKSGVIDIFETGLRVHGIGGETMTARLRRSLRKMGGALGLDSNTLEQKTCSRRIKRDAEYIANAVRQRCDPDYARRRLNIDKTPISKEDEAKFIMEMWQRSRAPNAPISQPYKSAEYDSASEDDDQFDPDFEEKLKRELDEELSQKRKEVEDFILNSEHLVILKNRLQSLFAADANIHGIQDKSTDTMVQEASASQNERATTKTESHRSQPEHTESDSESSVLSSISSMFSGWESKTSNTSVHHIQTQALRKTIADIFVEDLFISNAFKDALGSRGLGTAAMTKVLHIALKDMGKALKVDSETLEQRFCARRVRRDAEYIANSVRQQYDTEFKMNRLGIEHAEVTMSLEDQRRHIMSLWLRSQHSNGESAGQYEKQTEPRIPAQINPEVQRDTQSDVSEDDQIDPEAEETAKLKILELKAFILNSDHMDSLRDKLRKASFNHNPSGGEVSRGRKLDNEDRQEFEQAAVGNSKVMRNFLPEAVRKWLPKSIDYFGESPKPCGATRVRWTCVCGKKLYDDYYDLEDEQLQSLNTILGGSRPQKDSQPPPEDSPLPARAFSVTIRKTPVFSAIRNVFRRSTDGDGLTISNEWLSSMATALGHFLFRRSKIINRGGLPTTNPVEIPLELQDQGNAGEQNSLFLLYCLQAGDRGFGRQLHQVPTPRMRDDKAFFRFLRSSYQDNRKWKSGLRLRAVSEVGHCKMMVDFGDFASVQKHTRSCSSETDSPCTCWPPKSLIGREYSYVSKGLGSANPVAGPNYLLHYFEHPDHVRSGQKLLLRYVPLKMGARLAAGESEMIPGWGLYFEEGWHLRMIYIIIAVLMLVTSLVFGVTWTVVKSDIQGGFGVASYWATAATILMMVLGILADRSF